MTGISTAYQNNRVGPVMRHGDLALAVAEAAQIDNPGKTIAIDDKIAYLRIETDDELVLTRSTSAESLGRPLSLSTSLPPPRPFAAPPAAAPPSTSDSQPTAQPPPPPPPPNPANAAPSPPATTPPRDTPPAAPTQTPNASPPPSASPPPE